jgi:general secretion pathway protein G
MKLKRKLVLSNETGFTLMELMIVIAIIAILGGFVTTNVMKKYDESKVSATRIQMKQLGVLLDDFKRVCGFYPSTEQGLDALAHAPTGGRQCKNYDPDGFVKRVPQDAWGRDFIYTSDGNKYVVKSLGADGKEGGTGFDKDISTDDPDF